MDNIKLKVSTVCADYEGVTMIVSTAPVAMVPGHQHQLPPSEAGRVYLLQPRGHVTVQHRHVVQVTCVPQPHVEHQAEGAGRAQVT